MNETFQTKAIILDSKPFREYDAIVSVFCVNKGRLELVARGVKKPSSKLAGHIEPITLSNIMIARGRRYDYLAAAINENSFIDIKNDFDKINTAGQAIGVFKKLVKENEKDEKLFNLLYDFLAALNNYQSSIINYQLFFYFFILKLLSQLGYKPELYNCVICKNKITPNNNKFDLDKGGAACGGCVIIKSPFACPEKGGDKGGLRDLLTITDNCIKTLRIIIQSDFNKLLKLKIDDKLEKEVEKIINSFYKYNF